LIHKSTQNLVQNNTKKRSRDLLYGALSCLGRQTITGVITSSGQQFKDWTASYRLFRDNKIDVKELLKTSQKEVINHLESNEMLVAHMDDTIIKKTGTQIPGTGWRRDPLGPPFHTNFIWGQRFIQLSMSLPDHQGISPCMSIPVDFSHCPSAKRPGKRATEQQREKYREQQKQLNLSKQGVDCIKNLRANLDEHGAKNRELYVCVDGSYTNSNVLKNLPGGVSIIGRIRKDCRLYTDNVQKNATGRKKIYGEQIPTPEKVRQSDDYPWIKVQGWAAGKTHTFNVKVVKNLKWQTAGQNHTVQMVVIRPLSYRLTKNSKLIYRNPTYLICTDNDLCIEKLLQAYLWRWEIEVNFRDEKTLLGAGKAQVRSPNSAENVPAFIAAAYSFLLLASYKVSKNNKKAHVLPRSKWYKKKTNSRDTTGDLINNLRVQLWAKALGYNSFTHFVTKQEELRNGKKVSDPLSSAIFYARN